jgi:flagellar basal body-associated protein FliL
MNRHEPGDAEAQVMRDVRMFMIAMMVLGVVVAVVGGLATWWFN